MVLADSKVEWRKSRKTGKMVARLKPRGGLNPIEKEQVKTIAVREDRKNDQVHEVLGVSPAPNTGYRIEFMSP